MKLGKLPYRHDPRTIPLAEFLRDEIRVPDSYDFDAGKYAFIQSSWGNQVWRNCVVVAQANQLQRFVRMQQRRTLRIRSGTCVSRYKRLSGSKLPGDRRDKGLVMLDTLNDWRNRGMKVMGVNYTIAAYGELEPQDGEMLRLASYSLSGIHLGFWLPRAVSMMQGNYWDYQGETGPSWKAGSLGGHMVYSKCFTPNGHEILSAGQSIFVTNSFIKKYCDEAWAVVDDFNALRVKQVVDTDALFQRLVQIT